MHRLIYMGHAAGCCHRLLMFSADCKGLGLPHLDWRNTAYAVSLLPSYQYGTDVYSDSFRCMPLVSISGTSLPRCVPWMLVCMHPAVRIRMLTQEHMSRTYELQHLICSCIYFAMCILATFLAGHDIGRSSLRRAGMARHREGV